MSSASPELKPGAGSLAAVLSVPLVAFATELFRISRNHRLGCRSPGMQAQTVEAALELLKSFAHQGQQRQRARRLRRPLVHCLEFDMLRRGVDLLALGLRSQPQA
jgi:hypothetical protein